MFAGGSRARELNGKGEDDPMSKFYLPWLVVPACVLLGLAHVACGDGGKTNVAAPIGTDASSTGLGSPASSAPSLESSAQEIVLKFAKACFEIDTPTLQALSSPKLNWSKRAPGDFDIGEGSTCTPAARCLPAVESQSYPCRHYEVQQLRLDQTSCGQGTPADIANGLGSACLVTVRLAIRQVGSSDKFRDAKACFVVQDHGGGRLLVTKPAFDLPVTCIDFLL